MCEQCNYTGLLYDEHDELIDRCDCGCRPLCDCGMLGCGSDTFILECDKEWDDV